MTNMTVAEAVELLKNYEYWPNAGLFRIRVPEIAALIESMDAQIKAMRNCYNCKFQREPDYNGDCFWCGKMVAKECTDNSDKHWVWEGSKCE